MERESVRVGRRRRLGRRRGRFGNESGFDLQRKELWKGFKGKSFQCSVSMK